MYVPVHKPTLYPFVSIIVKRYFNNVVFVTLFRVDHQQEFFCELCNGLTLYDQPEEAYLKLKGIPQNIVRELLLPSDSQGRRENAL